MSQGLAVDFKMASQTFKLTIILIHTGILSRILLYTKSLLLSRFSRVRLYATPQSGLCSPPGSAVPGILQARTLEWVAISFPNTVIWNTLFLALA